MDNPIFKVTESFVKGERHVEVLRPLTTDDFDFETKLSQNAGKFSVQATCEVTARTKPDVLAEIKATFPVEGLDCRHTLYDRELRRDIAAGCLRQSETLRNDYRGCRDDASRQRKAERLLPDMLAAVALKEGDLKARCVGIVNGIVLDLARTCNVGYEDSAVQSLTQEWEGIHGQAGTSADAAEAKELFAKASAKLADVQKHLNAWMLAEMEKDGWKVNGSPLAGKVVARLRERYGKGEAFRNGVRIVG